MKSRLSGDHTLINKMPWSGLDRGSKRAAEVTAGGRGGVEPGEGWRGEGPELRAVCKAHAQEPALCVPHPSSRAMSRECDPGALRGREFSWPPGGALNARLSPSSLSSAGSLLLQFLLLLLLLPQLPVLLADPGAPTPGRRPIPPHGNPRSCAPGLVSTPSLPLQRAQLSLSARGTEKGD